MSVASTLGSHRSSSSTSRLISLSDLMSCSSLSFRKSRPIVTVRLRGRRYGRQIQRRLIAPSSGAVTFPAAPECRLLKIDDAQGTFRGLHVRWPSGAMPRRERNRAAAPGGLRAMAENARDPQVSPANTGSTESTAIQGAGDPLRRDDFYETVLAMASHDLRQPLQTIISAQELLARRLTTSPERKHLERSERASAQLAEQLDQLVDALHLHQSTGRTLLAPVALQPILGHLKQQLDGPARRTGVCLRLSSTPAIVMSHAALLDSVLRNLVRNALDHTLPGGRVLVCCRRRGAAFRIEVRDSGEGIPPDKLSTVFEPFFRLNAAHSDGLGLGLFIVKRAAECLGHRIEVRSARYRGSCFAVIAQAAHDPLMETSLARISCDTAETRQV